MDNKDKISPDLVKLGIELSKALPTYDVPIRLLSPIDSNPNEMDDVTFNRLVKELEETGMIDPIQIIPAPGGKFRILGGEHRWRGAQTLGWDTIPCNILTDDRFLDQDLYELINVRLNAIKGKFNPEKMVKLYQDKVKKYGGEQLKILFGFTDNDAWEKLTSGVKDGLKRSGMSKELLKDLEQRTKKVKNVDGLGKILTQIFKEHGSDLKHSFMVFSYGNKEHLYVIMSDETKVAMDSLKAWCRKNDSNINDVLDKVLRGAMNGLE